MPEPPRRPTPFLFLLLASPALKLFGAMWLAFGIVALYVAFKEGPKPDWKLGFAYGTQATMLLIQFIVCMAAGDFCIAIVDLHRDTQITRERLEKSVPAAPAAPIPPIATPPPPAPTGWTAPPPAPQP
ncbi:MAG: hypothetical protein HYY18_03815 [Planctomycetes bacterium]|nr:hypothetical protein [Planctomycetota bacterium]